MKFLYHLENTFFNKKETRQKILTKSLKRTGTYHYGLFSEFLKHIQK